MHFESGKLYHIYNRGNNKQKIFFTDFNYYFFIKKVNDHLIPFCDLLAYCLMPNHFHFLIRANEKTIEIPKKKIISKSQLSENLRIMLSSYTRAINNQENRTGSLFTQNTRSKPVRDWLNNKNYAEVCFNYIHKNPITSNLVNTLNDWPYSSYFEYSGKTVHPLCNIHLAKEILNINWSVYQSTLCDQVISKDDLKLIF